MKDVEEKFKELLKTTEVRKVDFKQSQYRLDDNKSKSRFVKDILCMANAPGGDGYILLGVRTEKGKPREVLNISPHYDSSNLEQIVNSVIDEPIQFEYLPLTYKGKSCAVLHIPESKARPHRPKNDYGVLERHIVYTRRASGNREASLTEIREMILSSIRVSDIAHRKLKSSKHIIDELADIDLGDRRIAMYEMIKSIAPKIHLTNYKLLYAGFRSIPVCGLVTNRSSNKVNYYAICMYPWTAEQDKITRTRWSISYLIEGSRSTQLKPKDKICLEESILIHVSYKAIYTKALIQRPYSSNGYWFANEWSEPWGKIIKWEDRIPKPKGKKLAFEKRAKYEFFMPNVTSEAELRDRLEHLLSWVDKNID